MAENKEISDLRRELETLRLENAHLKSVNRSLNSVVENSPASIVITNKQGVIEYVNPIFTKITGYTAEEAIGMHTRVFKSGYHPDEYYKAMWHTISSGKTWKDAFKNRRKDGSLYWEQQFITPIINDNNEISHFAAIKIDISLQKEYEEKLRKSQQYLDTLTKALPELILVLAEDGFLIDAITNEKLEAYKILLQAKSSNIFNVLPVDLHTILRDLIERTIKSNSIQIAEFPIEHRGKVLWFEARSVLLDYEIKENLNSIVAVIRDITVRKNAEQSLIELNATKDKFFSIIAHDLRNPFNALLGISEIMYNSDEIDVQQMIEMSKLINESSRNAYELLENLLQWSRSQTGQIKFEPNYHNLYQIVEQGIKIIEGQAFSKNVKVLNRIPGNEVVFADVNLLKTVIRNIVSNSIKYSYPHSEVLIYSESDKEMTKIVVSDMGKGMKPSTLQNLFKIDQKISIPGTNNEKGTGLGLILCKEFIDLHNGFINVYSEPEAGTNFKISLPLPVR
ncbi:MAG TPA: PAS domain-containing sensor histidine kinase [Bacteroidales bacterium]